MSGDLERQTGGPRAAVRRVFDVKLPPRRVWDVLSDTNRLNQLFFGVDRMEVLEVGSARARIKGGFGLGGGEFDEQPWEFLAPERFTYVRSFAPGSILRRNEVRVRLVPTDDGTEVTYEGDMVTTRSPLGWLARRVFERRMAKGLAKIEDMLSAQSTEGAVQWPPAYPHAGLVLSRAAPFADALHRRYPDDSPVIELLVGHLATALDTDLARMRPYELAEAWGTDRRSVLTAFLRATREGLLSLSWDLLCPSCENAPAGVEKLSELPSGMHCPACDVDYDVAFERNVEATFRPSGAVRDVQDGVFCYGSASRTPHWLGQLVVPAGEERAFEVSLGRGSYRVQAAGAEGRTLFEVLDDEGEDRIKVRLRRGEGERPLLPSEAPSLRAGRVSILVQNDDDRPRRTQLVHRDYASAAATALDVTTLGVFRDLFRTDVLAPAQHLRVGRTAILFTDLVGSTAMYERVGDAAAYAVVRRHFEILERAVRDHGGFVVKTIGDAVMAAFPRAEEAVRAGWRGLHEVARLSAEGEDTAGLALKVGVHVGPCLAVEANGLSDYFGRTVNIAARVQGLAGTDEMVLSAPVLESGGIEELRTELAGEGAKLTADRQAVKGVEGELDVLRVFWPRDLVATSTSTSTKATATRAPKQSAAVVDV